MGTETVVTPGKDANGNPVNYKTNPKLNQYHTAASWAAGVTGCDVDNEAARVAKDVTDAANKISSGAEFKK